MNNKNIRLESVEEHFKKWYKKQNLRSKIVFKFWCYLYKILIPVEILIYKVKTCLWKIRK